MSERIQRFKSKLERLSQEERAELACFLLQSLEPDEHGASEAWEREISRRVDEIRSGRAANKPAEQVFAESGGDQGG